MTGSPRRLAAEQRWPISRPAARVISVATRPLHWSSTTRCCSCYPPSSAASDLHSPPGQGGHPGRDPSNGRRAVTALKRKLYPTRLAGGRSSAAISLIMTGLRRARLRDDSGRLRLHSFVSRSSGRLRSAQVTASRRWLELLPAGHPRAEPA